MQFLKVYESITEDAIIAQFFPVHGKTLAEYAFRLRVGLGFRLAAHFGYPLDCGHLCARCRIWLEELFRFGLEFLHQLVNNIGFLQKVKGRKNLIGREKETRVKSKLVAYFNNESSLFKKNQSLESAALSQGQGGKRRG